MAISGPWLPLRRSDGLLTERVGDEVVVLDERSGEAHCLTAAAAAVWELCDGSHGVARIGELAGLRDGEAAGALAALRELGLLEPELGQPPRMTRRTIASRAMQAGAGALVLSAAIPAAAAAASGPGTCGMSSHCTGVALGIGTDPSCPAGLCVQVAGLVGICIGSRLCVGISLECALGLPCCVGRCTPGAFLGILPGCVGTSPCPGTG